MGQLVNSYSLKRLLAIDRILARCFPGLREKFDSGATGNGVFERCDSLQLCRNGLRGSVHEDYARFTVFLEHMSGLQAI